MNNYLEHHGVKGQKWGVRRYTNDDGTLTELGKSRYHTGFHSNLTNLTPKKMRNRDNLYDESGNKISRKDYNTVRKDLKKNDLEKFNELRSLEKRKSAFEYAIRYDMTGGNTSRAIAKASNRTVQEVREDRVKEYAKAIDSINKIMANHANSTVGKPVYSNTRVCKSYEQAMKLRGENDELVYNVLTETYFVRPKS